MHKHAKLGGSGGMLPQEILEIRRSEIASETIFGRKLSHGSYMARRVLYPLFGCPCMHVLSQLTSNFYQTTNVGRTAGGVASLERQLVSSRARFIHAQPVFDRLQYAKTASVFAYCKNRSRGRPGNEASANSLRAHSGWTAVINRIRSCNHR